MCPRGMHTVPCPCCLSYHYGKCWRWDDVIFGSVNVEEGTVIFLRSILRPPVPSCPVSAGCHERSLNVLAVHFAGIAGGRFSISMRRKFSFCLVIQRVHMPTYIYICLGFPASHNVCRCRSYHHGWAPLGSCLISPRHTLY